MIKRIVTGVSSLTLVILLLLANVAFINTKGCFDGEAGEARLNTIIASWQYAPTPIQNFNISPEEKERLSEGCRQSGGAFITYRDSDRTTPDARRTARNVLIIRLGQIGERYFAPVLNPSVQIWLDTLIGFGRIFLGLPATGPNGSPQLTGQERQRVLDSKTEVPLRDSDVKAFEKHVHTMPE